MLHSIGNHDHDSRFGEVEDFNAHVDDVFQSDCDVINHHLQLCYNFDKNENMIFIISQRNINQNHYPKKKDNKKKGK